MTAAKPNPGKFPVPQYALDWILERRKNNGGRGNGNMPAWWPTPELTAEICSLIAEGKSLRAVCEKEYMPPHQRILMWVCQGREAEQHERAKERIHPDIRRFYGTWSRACQLRLEGDVEKITEIEDRLLNTPQRIEDPQGRKDARGKPVFVPNPEALDTHAARIVLDSIKWRLSRMAPERFGDRSKIEHSGSVKVERPVDHMPEWMKAQLDDAAAKKATDPAPATTPGPASQQDDKPKTVH